MCLIVGGLVGHLIPSIPAMSTQQNMHANNLGLMQHQHSMLQVDISKPIPTINIEAIPDAKDGYNIHLITTDYKWAPEEVNQSPIQGSGHAHIYVNGVKVARVYGEWFHLSAGTLKIGDNEISVTLNANDHSEWVNGDNHIISTIHITL